MSENKKQQTSLIYKPWFIVLVCTFIAVLVTGLLLLTNKRDPENNQRTPTTQQKPTETTTPTKVEPPKDTATQEDSGTPDTQPPPSTPVHNTSPQPSAQTTQASCKYYDNVTFATVEKADSTMKEGQTRETTGYNGTRKVCTDANGAITSNETTNTPIDKVIYYGTFTYEQAQFKAKYTCNTSLPANTPRNSTFYWDCVDRELKKIW